MPVRYNDLYFRLIAALLAAHCIVAFGDKETLFQLLLDKYYYMALGSSFIIALILVTVVNFITRKLDKRFDWYKHPVQRTALQLSFALVIPSALAFILAALYFRLNGIDIFKTLYLQIDFPVIVGMIFIFNLYYLAYYFYLRMRHAERLTASERDEIEVVKNAKQLEVIIASRGTKNIPIQVVNIGYVYHNDEYNFARTFEKEDFLLTESLDAIQQQLSPTKFFRVNRQMLVNLEACEHFENIEHQKIRLYLRPVYNQPVVISQKRAKDFREWIKGK